jgi:hypothetical protein
MAMVPRAHYGKRDLGTKLMMCSNINVVLDRRRFRNLHRRSVVDFSRKPKDALNFEIIKMLILQT